MDVASKLASLREEVEAIYFANKLAVGQIRYEMKELQEN